MPREGMNYDESDEELSEDVSSDERSEIERESGSQASSMQDDSSGGGTPESENPPTQTVF